MKIKVMGDLFSISSRIKEVDRNYIIVFDTKRRRYEVHNTMQKDNTICFVIGKRLDYYAIVKAQKTSIKHLKRVVKNIDIQNERKQKKINDEISYKIRTNFQNCLNCLNNSTKSFGFDFESCLRWR